MTLITIAPRPNQYVMSSDICGCQLPRYPDAFMLFPILPPPGPRLARSFGPVMITRVLSRAAILAAFMVYAEAPAQQALSATEIPAATRLFGNDPRWTGCAGATALALRDGRILWLFSESHISQTLPGTQASEAIVHNSVALQIGQNPQTAEVMHFWDLTRRRPGPYFADGRGYWLWPVDGIEIGTSLLLLMFKVRPAIRDNTPEIAEWSILRILNPQDSPSRWKMQSLPTPANQFNALIGFGGLMQVGGYLLTGARIKDRQGELFLVRWSLDRVVRFDFTSPEWWSADDGWVSQEALQEEPSAVCTDLEGDIFMVWDSMADCARIFASLSGEPEVIVHLRASVPTGPWSDPEPLTQISADGGPARLGFRRAPAFDGSTLVIVPGGSSPRGYFPFLFTIHTR